MPPAVLPDLSIVLTFLRSGQGWSQADLGKAAGISPNLLNEYERGRKGLSRERLELLVAYLDLPPEAIDATLAALAANRATARAPRDSPEAPSEEARRVEAFSLRFGATMTGLARSTLSQLTVEGEALHARQRAGFLWDRLKRRAPAERRALVQKGLKYRTWALCERVAAESIRKAPNHPREALELAELALLIAERLPGERTWGLRLQGYTWAHVCNARRVCNDLPGAEEAMARARKLWEAGEPGDPGLLNKAWLPWIEAALRQDQRRFSEALKRIAEALALDPGELKSQILLSRSAIHQILGNPEGSAAALAEAEPLIDPRREPRLAFGVRFNHLVDLCHLGKFGEVAPRLIDVRVLAERLGEDLDMTRVLWLEGRVAAGLGRTKEALSRFEQVRGAFRQRELTFDYALVSLELAVLMLEEGRTAEVKTLAEEMLQIFRTQQIEREALAALRLFCDAARRETATVDFARNLVRFLRRAQYDPELRFTDSSPARD
ncbi:MAG TPA: helix-turn-helix transcriptional regulator [Thermoanaerobaculia bacterium]|nr:helix-turn-helix transcriptional regulator [Thermoanaerobaculia bacterium]